MASTTLEVIISAKDQFSGTANKVIGSLNRMDASSKRIGKGFAQMGAGMARAGVLIGTAAAGGLVAAGKAAIDFEDAFAGVRKTVDASEDEFRQIARSFRDLATEIPISATELSRIGEIAGQLGIKSKDIAEFTKTIALLGVAAPQLGTEEAAFGLARILTLTGQTTDKADELAAAIVDLGNNFATTEPAIVATAERFSSVASLAGISTQGILGLATAVTALGGEPQEAGTSLQRAIQSITLAVAEGGDELGLFAAVTGKTAAQFTDAWGGDALGTFQTFLRELGKLDNIQQTRILDELGLADARLGKTLLNLANSQEITTGAIDTANEAWAENTALTEESRKRFETIASRIKVLKNGFIEAGITIGEGFTPALGRAADKLTAFLKVDSNRNTLRQIGQDIGKAIDGIDWKEVLDGARSFVDVLKVALGFAKGVFDAFRALPTEIQAATVGFLALDKLSGGMLAKGAGNVIGGLAETASRSLLAHLPVVGGIAAMPVKVMNWHEAALFGGGGGGLTDAVDGGGKGGLVNWIKDAVKTALLVALPAIVIDETVGKGVRDAIGAPRLNLDNVKPGSDATKPFWERKGFRWPWETAPAQAATSNPFGGLSPDERSEARESERAIIAGQLEAARNIEHRVDNNAATIAAAIRQAQTIVDVDVHVTAAAVQKATVTQNRIGPATGSRGGGLQPI